MTLSCFQPLFIERFLRAEVPVPVNLLIDCFWFGVAIEVIIARMQLPDPSPTFLTKFHLVMMIAWVFVTPVTLRFPESVMWVAFMSQYANFVGHFASWDAARAEANNDSDKLLREVRELHRLVEELRAT